MNIDQNIPDLIETDGKRYRQVLFNLLGNAIKFTFKGNIDVNTYFINNYLATEIKDTGIGIKEEDQSKLFKFFGKIDHSSNINKGGMGLGLTISKMIVQELGGEINMKSIRDHGTTFTFSILIKKM